MLAATPSVYKRSMEGGDKGGRESEITKWREREAHKQRERENQPEFGRAHDHVLRGGGGYQELLRIRWAQSKQERIVRRKGKTVNISFIWICMLLHFFGQGSGFLLSLKNESKVPN